MSCIHQVNQQLLDQLESQVVLQPPDELILFVDECDIVVPSELQLLH